MKDYQKKILIYGIPAVVVGIASAIIAALVFGETAFYSICWALAGAALAAVVARVAYHLIQKDNTPEMWQISIYGVVSVAGWVGGILSTTWLWATFALAVMCIGILMATGTRFCKAVARERLRKSLERTLRYKKVGDMLSGELDTKRPLTVIVDSVALTVAEAEKAGYSTEAESGREYIALLLDSKEN